MPLCQKIKGKKESLWQPFVICRAPTCPALFSFHFALPLPHITCTNSIVQHSTLNTFALSYQHNTKATPTKQAKQSKAIHQKHQGKATRPFHHLDLPVRVNSTYIPIRQQQNFPVLETTRTNGAQNRLGLKRKGRTNPKQSKSN